MKIKWQVLQKKCWKERMYIFLFMKNNILGGLVIFMVVVTCLLMLDDISNPKEELSTFETVELEQTENQTDLAIIEIEE